MANQPTCAPLNSRLSGPIKIGSKTVSGRLWLAPMAGLTHMPFRRMADSFGGFGLLFTPMCSARALPTENPKISPVFSWRKEELPHLVCQIFGSEPQTMARAAQRIEEEGFFGVDINMGCCAPGIVKKGCGAALLSQPIVAAAVVRAVRKAVSIPVLVKFRTGWREDPGMAVALAKLLEEQGADALVFHPRQAPDMRTRPPRWEHIARIKQAVGIPVFGNGNVFTQKDCRAMLDSTGCDGVSIGRAAVVQPWLGRQWTSNWLPESETPRKTVRQTVDLYQRHFKPNHALGRFKTFIGYFASNFRFGHILEKNVRASHDLETAVAEAFKFLENDPALSPSPNPALFT